jgi:hypothetical protein
MGLKKQTRHALHLNSRAELAPPRDENEREISRPDPLHIPILSRLFSYFRENTKTVRKRDGTNRKRVRKQLR